jgi:fermentation-respiration switch protein FrsA (DUF1100 family)
MPKTLASDYVFDKEYPHDEISIKTTDNEKINALFFKTPSDKVILYFHGNAGSLDSWQYIYTKLKFLEYNFLIVDYRGYGKSTGKITEEGLYYDGQAAYDFLVQRGFRKENIILYGRSIGTGIAVDVASKNKSKALILESPFSTFKKLANSKLPFLFPSLLLKYSFDNLGKINRINTPLLIMHGEKDNLIPIKFGEELFNNYKGAKKDFLTIREGHHNDLPSFPEYSSAIQTFIESKTN